MKIRYLALCVVLAAGNVFAAEITVSAAASLSNAFKDIAAKYEKQYPQSKIKLNTAGSGALLQQALQGAPVDVLAFADQETMTQAQNKGLVAKNGSKVFAANSLVIAAPINSKLSVKKLDDLIGYRFDRIAISNPNSVPVGRYSKDALEKSGVWNQIQAKVITTQNVRQSLDYVVRGEVDAGFVYNTDAALMKDKVKILKQIATSEPVYYPIAPVQSSTQQAEAKRFIQYVLSKTGQSVLAQYGFKKP